MPEFTVYKGSKEGKIVKSTANREVGPDEVLVKVTHSGLCGTDEHFKCVDMCLGHEGAGIIEQVGSIVKNLAKGDSVGWGYIHNSCGHCKMCLTGYDTLCPERQMFGYHNLDQGSFAHYGVWKADFVFKLPDSMDRKFAAPLMCGGATVFSALRLNNVQPTERVGIVGLGGLGHLAIQFANKMGCEVVVFSQTESKKEEAMKLGAHEFYATKGVSELKIGEGIDHLLITTSFQPDWKQIFPIMAPNGSIYPLTVSSDDLVLPYMPIIAAQLRIQGSLVATRQVLRDMVKFANFHNIQPMIEEFPMDVEGIEASMKKLNDGKMRYRGVLVVKHE